jgi:putative transposase
MPDHVHLMIWSPSPDYSVARILREIKLPVSRRALAFLRCQAPGYLDRLSQTRGRRTEYHFWQRGGGYDRNVTETETLSRMIDYIHLNPVRKQLAAQPSDWKWSSAGWYQKQAPNDLPPDPLPREWLNPIRE